MKDNQKFSLRLPPSLYEKLMIASDINGLSKNAIIVFLLRKHLDEFCEPPTTANPLAVKYFERMYSESLEKIKAMEEEEKKTILNNLEKSGRITSP